MSEKAADVQRKCFRDPGKLLLQTTLKAYKTSMAAWKRKVKK